MTRPENSQASGNRDANGWVSSITARLVLLAILLVSLTAVSVGAYAFAVAREALEREATTQLKLHARTAADQFHEEISARIDDTRYWSGLEVMRALLYRDVDKQLAEFLRSTLASSSIYRAIACYDSDGALLASAGDPHEAGLAAALGQEKMTTGSLDRGSTGSTLLVQTPVPHPDDNERWIGTIVLAFDPSPAVLNKLGRQTESPGRISTTIRSKHGVVLSSGAANGISEAKSDTDPSARAGDNLSARAKVRRVDIRSAPQFEAVATTSPEVAFAAIREMRRSLVTTGIWAVLAGSAIGIIFAWGISQPIRRLTSYIQSVENSESFDRPGEVPGGPGEVGILADAFSKMMSTVSEAHRKSIEQSRMALLGEVAGNIAHEIRTPLSVLKTSAELISRPTTAPEERERLSALAVAEVDRLNRVVTDLVEIGRPHIPSYGPVRSGEVVERAGSFFDLVSDRDGIDFSVDIADPDAVVRADEDQLYQVLLNVIRNATQAVGGDGRVAVSHRRNGRSVIIEVSDNGPGVDPELAEKLFSPFVTTKKDGTGLGLAISKRLVEEHGGEITIANAGDGGARVTLRLPLIDAQSGRPYSEEAS